MERIQLYYLDDDNSYCQRLTEFIRTSEFAEKLQIKLFPSRSCCKRP
ncbi:hypothetical protein [Paenibacillus hexagrammi]|uniref:Uncharacterized protein n=1 Tax=Paenibacillus hexagrammi TaxID=2908839 RepID=A0ABY3SQ35_9BACL|nr:hypothetical protein [Paenibacillus sp. YPD9-1]UJF35957.1 hypothetical protein L0M14_13255 [Paenibacillus sp. YPD9-1]